VVAEYSARRAPSGDAAREVPIKWGAMAHGVLLALVAAFAFGASTPVVQRFGRDAGPFWTAALLYAGAAVASLPQRAPGREARLRGGDLGRLALVAALGAFLAPVALAWGLKRTSGASAALMLNLEAGVTIALGRLMYREHVGRRVLAAALLIGAGGATLIVQRHGGGGVGGRDVFGLAAVAVATAAWALDNALSRPLADRDAGAVVLGKGGIGALLGAAVAFASHDVIPSPPDALGIAACGVLGFGASLRLYLLAQRRLGAARTASVFAVAPFVGASVAIAMGEQATAATLVPALAMALGVYLHATEAHAHPHAHDPLEHEHAHRHDDGHHDHPHAAAFDGEHSHPHRHGSRTHAHAHGEDLHHRHHD
jgi:drug/metabolite transporter (DMT)-like permease